MDEVEKPSQLSLVLPPSSPVAGSSPMEVDPSTPKTPKIASASSHPAPRDGSAGAGVVPVVTPVAAPPALRLTEAQVRGVPSAPSVGGDQDPQTPSASCFETSEEANETQEAAVLLTALSALAAKEVHVDGVTDLLSLSSAGGAPPPPLPDLSLHQNDPPPSHGMRRSPVPTFRSLCTAAAYQEKADEQRTPLQHIIHAPVVSPQESNPRARAVSIDAVMVSAAADLTLPCEPCYDEDEDMAEAAAPQQQAPVAFVGQGLSISASAGAPAVAGTAAALVSPPSSPAFRPRSGGNSSPRSADRRKRFLDLHGADYMAPAFEVPSSSPSSASPDSSPSSPSPKSRAVRKIEIEGGELPPSHKGTLQPTDALRGKVVRVIVRKKFSWKNYPELERFLVANREEYLRHSALNYTVQQKRYNNRLTERLLQLATEHGYAFDESDFSFVTVRDRIRCYFKSYVQSSKKRGLVVGYAARRAGLLTRDELERSAGTAGRIVVPGEEEGQRA